MSLITEYFEVRSSTYVEAALLVFLMVVVKNDQVAMPHFGQPAVIFLIKQLEVGCQLFKRSVVKNEIPGYGITE